MTALIDERRKIAQLRAQKETAWERSRARHDPFKAHPGLAGILSPWMPGCPDCEREEVICKESAALLRANLALLRDLAVASEKGHTRRLAGLTKAAAKRSNTESPAVLKVRRYCKEHGLSFTKRKLSYQIHHDLKIPLRTVQHALRSIIKK